jgi:DNA-binding response OmpR family regulator
VARILVIDDDPAIVDLLRMRLEDLGHQVFQALDATGGMMIAAREKPDLITLDFKMPAGNGADLLKRLRGNTFTAKAKILFVTGMSEYDLEHAVPQDPATRFLQKPVDIDALKRLVAELLGEPAPAAAPPPAAKKPAALDGGALGGDILDLKLPP